MIRTAPRMQNLTPHFFSTLSQRLAELQRQGADVIRLDEGSPDLPPPPEAVEALVQAARRPDRHRYQPHRGPQALRQAWAEMYARVHQVALDPEAEVLPLLGSKEGIFHLSQVYVAAGDVILVPDPGYVTYVRGARFAGGEVYRLPLTAERGYLPDLQAVPAEVIRRARLLWLNYPHNPTAAVATLEFFEQAVAFARAHHLLLCHDAAYSQVTFDGQPAPSLLQIPGAKDVAVEFNSLSKSHNLAGWRLGVVVGQAEVLRNLHTLKTNQDSGHFLPIMEAAVQALQCSPNWIAQRNAIYRERRDVALAGLRRLGLAVQTPQASIYVWSPLPPGWQAEGFVLAALERAQVSLTPGTVFGPGGEGFFRLALTESTERIAEAMQRLERFLSQAA